MRLWPHQEEALSVCAHHHQRPRSRVLVQVPPGTGKTEIAARIALHWVTHRPFGRALVCVSSGPVLAQFRRRLCQLTRLPIAIERAHQHAPRDARIIIATQQSLWGRLHHYARDTLLIYDECHHSNLDAPQNLKLAQSFAHIVGLSATPWSRGCIHLFADSARVHLPLWRAERDGLVAPHEIHPWTPPAGPLALAFCATNKQCQQRAATTPRSTWIGVQLADDDITRRIASWRSGATAILYANRMLLEGFDEPRCSNVWLDKETDSDVMLVQMAGRALRARPGKSARIYCATSDTEAALRSALARCNQPVFRLV